jgi:intein/homing endonuclease
MRKKLIGLEDLPKNFKVSLEDSFRKKLFEKAVKNAGGFIKLAKLLKVDWSSLSKIRRGYRLLKNRKSPAYMRITLLKRLIKLTKLSTSSIEKNIVGVLTNKAVAYTKLPIFASEELASIIGNAFGDGYVSNQKFKYVNKRKELVIKVKENMRNVFGVNDREFYIKNKKCYGIEFPEVVGKLLIMVGAPNGRKTIQKTIIPAWIKRGDSGIKSNFLKTLFDDDGSVCLGKYQKFITISFYKNKSIVSNLIKFLK